MNHTEPGDAALTDAEREELTWLRAENAFLRVQRDILTRIATGYAHDVEAILGRRVTDASRRRPT